MTTARGATSKAVVDSVDCRINMEPKVAVRRRDGRYVCLWCNVRQQIRVGSFEDIYGLANHMKRRHGNVAPLGWEPESYIE